MCGIAGDITFSETATQSTDFEAMLRVLRYRGPDEVTAQYGKGWSIGARRLRVVALDCGSQPFVGSRGTICVFNGEIYNYAVLRAKLKEAGVTFATESDGEVIVHLYERNGCDFVHLLRGMFSIALYEPATQQLILARDRIGKKPLFYHHQPGRRVVFGSSLNSVTAAQGVPRRIDVEALDYFLSYRIIPAPLTIYRDVRKVEPGSLVVIGPDGSRETRYWTFPQYETPAIENEAAAVEELRRLVETALETRIPSEVPFGFFLSGGLDSSYLVSLVQKRSSTRANTFSIGFAHSGFDERPFSRRVAQELGTDHAEYEITPDDALAAVPELAWHFGEPFAFPSSIACYYMSRLARRRATVVLGGDGADELFAGYRRYQRLLSITGRLPAEVNGHARPKEIADEYEPVLIDGLRTDYKLNLLAPEIIERIAPPFPRNRLADRISTVGKVEYLNRILALDCGFWLPDAQMCKVDVASMAHSLEVRHPMLDETVVEFACRLPANLKLRDGEEKYLLRRAAEPFVPSIITRRRKQELAVPLEDWLTGHLRKEMVNTLTSSRCLERGYFRPDKLREFVVNFDSSKVYAIWTLYILECWHRQLHDAAFE